MLLDSSAVGHVFSTPPDPPPLKALWNYALSLDIDEANESIYRTSGVYTESAMEFMTPRTRRASTPSVSGAAR